MLFKSPISVYDYKPLIICLIIAGLMTIWIQYTLVVDPDVPRADQFPLIIIYDDLVKGKISIFDLWAPKGGHRFPGYQGTFFFNIKYFGYNPMIEIFVAMAAYAVAAYLIAISFFHQRIGPNKGIRPILEGTSIAFITLALMFNGQTLQLSMYSLIAMRLLNFAGFVVIAMFTYKYIATSSKKTLCSIRDMFGFVACVIFLLLFGRGWGVGATAAILSTLGVYFLASRDFMNPKRYSPYIVTSLFFLIYALIYFNGLVGGATDNADFDLIKFLNHTFKKIGLAITGIGPIEVEKSSPLPLYFGLAYMATSVFFPLVIIKKGATDKATWLALFLMLFSFFAVLLISINQYTRSPYFIRHNIELCLGLVGISYFIFNFLFNLKPIYFKVITHCLAVIVVIIPFSGLLEYTSKKNYVKNYNIRTEKLTTTLLQAPNVKAEYNKVQCRLTEKGCIKVFKIMKTYGIGSKEIVEGKKTP